MKVLQVGNANFGYVLSKELRKRGIQSDLLISQKIISGPDAAINDPLSHDKEADSYPNWVHFGPINSRKKIFNVVKFMKNYDIIHAYNATPIHAMLSGKPYLAQTGGDELRIKAFEKSITGFLLKSAFKKADQLVYVWPVHKPLVKKLGIKNPIYLPRIWDTQNFEKTGQNNPHPDILTILLPTSEIWKTKGNEKFLQAFLRIIQERKNIFLYFIDWGPDSEKAKNLLRIPIQEGLVEVVPGPISREQMTEYMEKSDLLVDQFNSGSFTRMAIEAFKFGIPILINIDENLHKELHGESPPVINVANEEQIYSKLKELCDSKEVLNTVAKEAKHWALKNFDLQKNVDRYLEIYKKILKTK